jgi:hypothetical protein
MKHVPLLKPCVFAVVMATAFAPLAAQADESDFGIQVEKLLKEQSEKLFGVEKPLETSAAPTVGPYRTALQTADDQILAAPGLKVEFLTREAANATDMMAFYPEQNPTHLITCVEGGRQFLIDGGAPNVYDAGDKLNPSVQRIDLATGATETILRGMSACDGIRTTAWGTILATEERTDGGAYEIFNPLGVSEQTVIDRASGAVTDPANIAKRTALPTMAWEGIAVLPNGVVIAGDELRPGSPANADGGAIFKFVPAMPRLVPGPIGNLSESPLVAGSVYAMQVSCVSNTQQYGQGCEIGNAAWVAVNAATARTDANTAGVTGYYRPEDLHQDPMYQDEANPEAVRFCWTNTGNEGGKNYAEVMCGVDKAPLTASSTQRTVVANRFVEGDTDFNSFDNLEFQPKTDNVYVIEDHNNGDIFACLPDGMDRDIKTDGCVRILSVADSSAEPTGFLFDASGTTAYVSIQHSDDTNMPLVDDYRSDDVLKITGFKLKKSGWNW